MKIPAARVIAEARDLRDQAFKLRDQDFRHEEGLRFGTVKPDVPAPYNNIATVYASPDIQDQGMQIAAMMTARPLPYMVPPDPEEQEHVTNIVSFLSAAHQELESTLDHAWWKSQQSQIFHKFGCIKSPLRRDYFSGAPDAPAPGRGFGKRLDAFKKENERYKRDAGIAAVFDYLHVPSDTIYFVGPWVNPLAIYEAKEVETRELLLRYGLHEDPQTFELSELPPDVTTLPAGRSQTPRYSQPESRRLLVVEYWDRDDMMIVVENPRKDWRRRAPDTQYYVLEEWHHGWGRVPYFLAPAFETDSQDERYRFSTPLFPLYQETPLYNSYRTMASNVMWLTGYPSWWLDSPQDAQLSLDDAGNVKEHIAFRPGMFFQPAPGQKVMPLPMQSSPTFMEEVQASEKRMMQYSVASIAKGVSPGADTANAAIAQLQRLMKSNLDPLAQNQSIQAREMYRFWLRRIRDDIKETVYAFSEKDGETRPLNPKTDLISLNVQVEVKPDVGQDQLVIEKHGEELNNLGLITDLEFHAAYRNKENPEQYVLASSLDRLRKRLEVTVDEYLLAMLGQSDAAATLVQAQQQTGDAHNGIAQVMQNFHRLVQGQLPPGVGPPPQEAVGAGNMGSPGQPRAMGVRSPAVPQTTQPALAQTGAPPGGR